MRPVNRRVCGSYGGAEAVPLVAKSWLPFEFCLAVLHRREPPGATHRGPVVLVGTPAFQAYLVILPMKCGATVA